MKIFSGSNYLTLTNQIISELKSLDHDVQLGDLKIDKFSDGEILPLFRESVRDEDVFFVNSTDSSDAIMESILVIDAAKRAGCNSFTLVAPFQGYSRQDKTDHLRSSIGSKALAVTLEAVGLTRLVTIDLHASSIQGFYQIPVIHLNGNKIFIDYIKEQKLDNLCIVAPDQGAVKRASDFCKAFPEATFALINKKRIKPNEIHSMELVGDVSGKNVIIVDDMADTLGTMKKAADLLIEKGALSVVGVATHGVLSGKAMENLLSSKMTKFMVSDSISTSLDKEKNQITNLEPTIHRKLEVVSSSRLIAKSISAISQKKSINEINLV
jgi:ribose-phosphate pyrophosphokinase